MKVKCDHVLECEIDLFFSDVLGFGGGNDRGFASSDAISGLGAISWCNRFPVGERSSNGEEWTHCDVHSSVLVWGCVNSSNSKSSPNSFSKNASSKTLSLALSLPFCPLLRLPSLFTRASIYGTRVIKCNRIPRQKGGHGPRRSMRRLRKLGMRVRQLVLSCAAGFSSFLRNYAVFCEERVAEIYVFYAHVTYKRTRCSW